MATAWQPHGNHTLQSEWQTGKWQEIREESHMGLKKAHAHTQHDSLYLVIWCQVNEKTKTKPSTIKKKDTDSPSRSSPKFNSAIIYPHVIPNLYDFPPSVKHKRRNSEECWCCSFQNSDQGPAKLQKGLKTNPIFYFQNFHNVAHKFQLKYFLWIKTFSLLWSIPNTKPSASEDSKYIVLIYFNEIITIKHLRNNYYS